jgi:hypothetical protein
MTEATHLPKEVLQAEVLDWWEAQREMIAAGLKGKLPELFEMLDAEIDNMPTSALLRKGKFRTEYLEPIVVEFLENTYQEYSSELDEAFQKSVAKVEAERAIENLKLWSYKELATAGAATAITVAPLATLPFLASGFITSGLVVLGFTVTAPAIIPTAVGAATVGLALAAVGPAARRKAIEKLKYSFTEVTHKEARIRLIGDTKNPKVGSLKGTLLNDLRSVVLSRIERLT